MHAKPIGFLALLALLVTGAVAQAQTALPLDEIRSVSELAEPAQSDEFEITQAGSYEVVLTDLGAQLTPAAAPMDAVQFGLTRGTTLAVARESTAPLAAPLYTLATTATLSAGRYVIRVTGKPGTTVPGSGAFQVSVRPTGVTTPVFSFAGALVARPPAASTRVALVQATTPSLPAGSYVAELVDFAFPSALSSATALITAPGAGTPAAVLTVVPPALTATFPFQTTTAGPLNVFALADSGSVAGGLMRVRIRSAATSEILYTRSIAAGNVAALGAESAAVPAGTATLAVTDTGFPAALSSFGILVAGKSNVLARATTAGTTSVTVAEAGAHEAFGYGVAPAASGGGAVSVELRSGSSVPLSQLLVVTEPDSGRFLRSFPLTAAVAGAHTVQLTDLQLPAALTSAGVAVVQGGSIVQRRDSPGSLPVTLAAGPLQLLVRAATVSATGQTLTQVAGLLGLSVTPPTGARLLDTTVGVGALFAPRSFTVTSATDLRIAVDDLRFPRPFADLAAAVTRGSERLGLVFGSGSFDVLQAPPGEYIINFLAVPDATLKAGTYRITAGVKPPNPTITLSASPADPVIGATATLTWNAQNATSCSASGGWTGSRTPTGTEVTAALNTPATFTLTCTGAGGTAAQTLTVTPRPATSTGGGGGGGGGAFDLIALLGLGALLAAPARARRRHAR